MENQTNNPTLISNQPQMSIPPQTGQVAGVDGSVNQAYVSAAPRSFPKFSVKFIGLALVLIGLVSAGLYFGKFANNTKTYQNDLFGFSFRYDSESTIYENAPENYPYLLAISLSSSKFVTENNRDNEKYLTMEVTKGDRCKIGEGTVKNFETKDLSVSGMEAKLVEFDGAYDTHYYNVCLSKDDHLYTFFGHYILKTPIAFQQEIRNKFDAVLSTFKFTETPTSAPSEVNLPALGDNKLAYVKNGDIFLADKNGVEQITSGHTVSNIKTSQDGKYLGWIENKDFTFEDGTTRSAGYAISLINLATLETTYDAIGPLDFVSRDDIYKKEISSFDYLTTDPLVIVYTSDGVWKRELLTKKNEKLLANDYGKNDDIDDEIYISVSKIPNINKLLLRPGGYGTCVGKIYDLNDNRFVESGDFYNYGCRSKLSKDWKSFLVNKSFDESYGGLWLIDVESGKITKTIYDSSRETNLSFHDVDAIGNDQLVTSVEEEVIDDKATRDQVVRQFQKGIYEIKNFDKPEFRLIKQVDNTTVFRLDNYSSNKISYSVDSSLRTVDLDGQDDQLIVEGISEYAWIPAKQITTNNSTKTTIKPNTYTSSNLGIKFSYLEKPPINQNGIEIKEISNKIYLYGVGEKPESGQYVEAFSKSLNDDFVTTVKKQILANYSDSDCTLEIQAGSDFSANYPQEYKIATITYADSLIDSNGIVAGNENKCPANYLSYGGRAFFLYDEKHPESFLFFSIGQYGIEAENGKMWEETIEFID